MATNTKLDSFPDKSFTLSFTVTATQISAEKESTLKSIASNFENKGFRKGKAPASVVESQISPEKLLEEVINSLLPKIYSQAIIKYQLKPATSPNIIIKNPPFALNKDWQIELHGAQIPDISIDPKFFTEIKAINQSQNLDQNKKTDEILKKLIGFSQVSLAKLIIDNDLNRKLADLVDQTQAAGITIDSYLKNRNQSLEDYKKEMSLRISEDWTLNLAISQIAADQKIVPLPAEIEDLTKKNPKLSSNPSLVSYLLTQQKVIDFLTSQ
jgi:FKBP-type peptidyl-prolyl cis-trans isomerase (trigger factor)